ncbi:hypothetical protein BDV33DRAFT_211229 [Aspergillus novoparasiticus]|uniref:Uncharacterized protein n=1 Tax=Aspergillus novoparasiticus TaxID=986946 RepID=A0A5N6E4W6_9EURO|nr:hypothetical protein BDV33DRAFT_211229 [Aspergillus novoparasiticus]
MKRHLTTVYSYTESASTTRKSSKLRSAVSLEDFAPYVGLRSDNLTPQAETSVLPKTTGTASISKDTTSQPHSDGYLPKPKRSRGPRWKHSVVPWLKEASNRARVPAEIISYSARMFRRERHSMLYGFRWPKTDGDGLIDDEERVMDHRTVHRFLHPEEEARISRRDHGVNFGVTPTPESSGPRTEVEDV